MSCLEVGQSHAHPDILEHREQEHQEPGLTVFENGECTLLEERARRGAASLLGREEIDEAAPRMIE